MVPVVVLITDPRFDRGRTTDVIRAAARALGESRLLVQLRDKTVADEALHDTARYLRNVTREAGALFVVNGNATIASDVLADGLHLPSGRPTERFGARIAAARSLLGEGAFISTAAHDDDDVQSAIAGGATAVLVSAIFASPGKGAPRGVLALASARAHVRSPLVYALGGVTGSNAPECAAAGATGVAVIRELFDADDVELAARELAAPFLSVS